MHEGSNIDLDGPKAPDKDMTIFDSAYVWN